MAFSLRLPRRHLSDDEAAVGGQNLSGEEGGGGGGQEVDGLRHVGGRPNRPIGVSSASRSRVSWEANPIMSVSMTPGATELTVIPEGATSLARALEKADYRPLGGGVGHLAGPAHLGPTWRRQ